MERRIIDDDDKNIDDENEILENIFFLFVFFNKYFLLNDD